MEQCYIKYPDGWLEVEFMGLFPVLKTRQGIPYSTTVAVIKLFVDEDGATNGYLNEVDFRELKFVKQEESESWRNVISKL